MKLAVRTIVSVGILVVLAFLLPWSDVRMTVGQMSAPVWFGVFVGFVGGHQLGVIKWRLVVNAGRAGLRLGEAVRCYAAGLFTNLCLPSIVGGDVLRATLAGKVTRRPEAVVLAGVADRLIDVVTLGLLLAAGGVMVGSSLPDSSWRLVVALPLAAIVVGAAFLPWIARRPLAKWPRRVRRTVGRSFVAVRQVRRRPATAVAAVLLSLFIQTMFVMLNAWIGWAIGIDVGLAAWFLAWPLAKFAGLLPISLGGLGVRDATLGAALVPFGVPAARGVIASLIWQSVLIAGGLIGGLTWWWLGRSGRMRRAPTAAHVASPS